MHRETMFVSVLRTKCLHAYVDQSWYFRGPFMLTCVGNVSMASYLRSLHVVPVVCALRPVQTKVGTQYVAIVRARP